jgi:hypothetical protein
MTFKDYLSALKQLPGLVGEFRRGPRETRLMILAAASLFLGGALASDLLPKDLKEQAGRFYLPWLFIAIGVGLVIWLGVLLFRLALPLPGRGETIRPSAIKGPGPFGPQDGSLFSRLGRADEIATLLGYVLDDQVGLVAVMGESGAGKTSLLRSGLNFQLTKQQPAVPYAYWEALPTDPVAGLLFAIGAYLEGTEGVPTSLEELLSWAERGRGVVVLDQLEQLDPQDAAQAPIFEFLSRLGRRRPPHRSTWIVAFRREYDWMWRQLELDHPDLRSRMFSLKLLPRAKAKAVMATLGETVELSLQDALLEDMLGAVSQGGQISPVDVGIGMLVLYELAEKLERRSLTLDDYRVAGGAEGLLTGYIVERLSRVVESERGALLKGLLLLVDLESDRRVAEGRTLEEMAAASGLPAGRMRACLDLLVEARLVEEWGQDGFRLLHERIISPLRRLTGSILAERDRARMLLEQGLRRWQESGGRWGLLAGAELRLVWRNRHEIFVLSQAEIEVLRRSRNRLWQRRALGVGVALMAAALLFGVSQLKEREAREERYRTMFAGFGLPIDLRDRLGQLRGLRVSMGWKLVMDNLEWLDQASALTMLDLRGTPVASLRGLPRTVTTLKVSTLPSSAHLIAELPSTVRNLTLRSERGLPSLLSLPPSLESLTLSVADGADLPDLGSLPPSLRSVTVVIEHLEILSPESSRTPPVPGAVPWVYSKLGGADSLVIGSLDSRAGRPDLSGLPASVKTLALALLSSAPAELPSLPSTVESLALHLQLADTQLLGRLPAKVAFLLLSGTPNSRFAPGLARLPATVKSLALKELWWEPAEDLNLKRLASINWLYVSITSQYPTTWILEPPPSLRRLRVEVELRGRTTLKDLERSIELHGPIPGGLLPSSRLDTVDLSSAPLDSLDGAPASLSQVILRPRQVRNLDGLPKSVRILEFQEEPATYFRRGDTLGDLLEEAGSSSRAKVRRGRGPSAAAVH